MALIAPNGNYRKIDIIDFPNNSIVYKVYENQEHRLSWDTEFHKSKKIIIPIDFDVIVSQTPDIEKTLEDNLKSLVYEVTKTIDWTWLDELLNIANFTTFVDW